MANFQGDGSVSSRGARRERRSWKAATGAAFVGLPLAVIVSCSGASRPNQTQTEVTDDASAGDDVGTSSGDDNSRDSGHVSTSDATVDGGDDGASEAGDDAVAEASTKEAAASSCTTPDDAGPGDDYMMCSTGCLNVGFDSMNCGGCSQPCATSTNGTVCIAGHCLCPSGKITCGNQCTDTSSDQNNCGSCGRTCQGNACVNSLCQVSQVASIQPPNAVITDIAVDSTYVYWTQGQEAPNGANYKPFSGGSIVSILESPDPRGIVADGTNVFWTDFETGGIYSYGTVVKALQPPLVAAAEDGGPAAGSPTAITTDGTNVYWVDPVANTVSQISVNGGTPHVLAQSQSNPVAIAVYGANVYWIDYASGSSDGSIDTVPVGSTNATVKALVTGETKPWGLAVDGTSVYWTDETNPGTVKSFPTAAASGAAATVLATNQGAPTGIAVDAQYVYWTNFNDGTVVKVALTGGTPFVLASGLNNPSAIAVDNKNVYWADGDATIDKVAK